MAGMVGDLRRMITKSNQEMARLTIEDYYGVITAIVFPRDYAKAKYVLENDAIVAIKGTLSFKEDSDPEILVNKVTEIERISEFKEQGRNDFNRTSIRNYSRSKVKAEPLREKQYLKLRVSQELSDMLGNDEIQQRILGAVSAHRGDTDMLIYLPGQKPLKSANGVDIDENLLIELEQLLGKENVKH